MKKDAIARNDKEIENNKKEAYNYITIIESRKINKKIQKIKN